MSVNKLKSGKFQAKIRGTDGTWITKAFATNRDAEAFEAEIKRQRYQGVVVTNQANLISVDKYFEQWLQAVKHQASPGWRECQQQFYKAYVSLVIGRKRLKAVSPSMIAAILNQMVE